MTTTEKKNIIQTLAVKTPASDLLDAILANHMVDMVGCGVKHTTTGFQGVITAHLGDVVEVRWAGATTAKRYAAINLTLTHVKL